MLSDFPGAAPLTGAGVGVQIPSSWHQNQNFSHYTLLSFIMPIHFYTKAETRRLCVAFSKLSWEHMHQLLTFFATLFKSTNAQQSDRSTDFGVAKKF